MSDVTEESLLDYFYLTGGNSGKVKNADLLKTYKPYIGHSDLQLRAKYREEFKLIIDRIAVVKSENGEKFLVLRKKYRPAVLDLDSRHHGTDGDGQRTASPRRTPAAAQWDTVEEEEGSSASPSKKADVGRGLDRGTSSGGSGSERSECSDLPPSHESESEQDEEFLENMGSTAVALDPIEKDWIYSAASARVPDLSQLLQQDPSLANKKDFTSFTALHWAAKHGKEDMATLVLTAGADVNTKSGVGVKPFQHFSKVCLPFDTVKMPKGYTPLHIAAMHGHRHILDLLVLTYGAKENLRDYSGHFACHYLNVKEPDGPEEDSEIQFHVTQARERSRNRKLPSLFLSKKKWGSAEELAPIEEERSAASQLMLPAFRPRKFSR